MIKVGITGGIGSGKSLVCRVFAILGVPVYEADARAKSLMESSEEIRNDLSALLGNKIYSGNKVNRTKMTGLIFEDPELLAAVNAIVHPHVAADFNQWCIEKKNSPFIVQESAILFESGFWRNFDVLVMVTAPREVRIQRVLNRPGLTREIIEHIMNTQLPEEEKILRSHFILNNDGEHLILPGILEVYQELSARNK